MSLALAPTQSLAPSFAGDRRPIGAARHRSLSEQMADPSVIVEYRPGVSPLEYSELFGGPHGPDPQDVVRSVCRALSLRPVQIETQPDPRVTARCYIGDAAGARLGRVTGLSADQFDSALMALSVRGWIPAGLRGDDAFHGGRA